MFLPQLDYSLLPKRLQHRSRIIFIQPLYLIPPTPKTSSFHFVVNWLLGKTRHQRIKCCDYTSLKNNQHPNPASGAGSTTFSRRKQGNQPFSTSCSVCGKIPLWYHRIPAKVEGIQSTCTCLHVVRVLKGRWISLPLAGTPQTEDLCDKTECHFVREASKVSKKHNIGSRNKIVSYDIFKVK